MVADGGAGLAFGRRCLSPATPTWQVFIVYLSSPSATATAYAIFPSYSCRFHVPLSLNNLSFSTPSPSPSCISTSIKSTHQFPYNSSSVFRKRIIFTGFEADSKNIVKCTGGTNIEFEEKENEQEAVDFDFLGTGQDVEGVVSPSSSTSNFEETVALPDDNSVALGAVWEWAVLVSPFFFWGTAMVAMKEVIPKYGPFLVSSFRLIPAVFLLIAFAASRNRPSPSGLTAWLSISFFALVDATCFQGFLAEGLQKTSAGLGSVIIDSQPLTVAILAALLFGESIGFVGAAGLVLGVIGLLLLEKLLGLDGNVTTSPKASPKGVEFPMDLAISKVDQKIIIKCGSPELKTTSKNLIVLDLCSLKGGAPGRTRGLDFYAIESFSNGLNGFNQVVTWLIVPKLIKEEGIKLIMTTLLVTYLFQFLPKIYHSIYLLRKLQKITGYIFGSDWWRLHLNLLAYFIASHVVGGCWYALSTQRLVSCLQQQQYRDRPIRINKYYSDLSSFINLLKGINGLYN